MILRPLALSLLVFAAFGEDRVPLTSIPYDTVTLTNGENLKGTVVERLSNGAVRFQMVGRQATVVEKDLIVRIDDHLTLAEAVGRRARQALAAGDLADLQRTLRFAIEATDPPPRTLKPGEQAASTALEVRTAAATVAALALDRKPTPELAASAVTLYQAMGQPEAALAAADRGLVADPNWTTGYEIQAKILQAAGDQARMARLVDRWLQRQPTAFLANRFRASMAESTGDLKAAGESWRKGWDLHQDPESALGAIRTAIGRGDTNEALRVAKALGTSGKGGNAGIAWLGIAQLSAGEAERAAPLLLTASQATDLDPATLQAVRWNLGVLALGQGQDATAQQWFDLTPHADLAKAWRTRKPLPTNLPASMAGFAKDYQTAIDLENRRYAPALKALDGDDRPRAVFLTHLAALLKTQGSPAAINAVAATATLEARRWQAYGHLVAERDREAEEALKTLPEDDGWALCCRIWMASNRKDDTTARALLARLSKAKDVPAAYAERLMNEFAAAQDEIAVEGFDGDRPYPEGWQVALGGPGLQVSQAKGALRFDGTGSELPAIAWREWPASRLRRIETAVGTINGGAAGLVLADANRKNGLMVALTPAGPAWRILSVGTWGPWTALTGDGTTRLTMLLERGRIRVQAGDAAPQEVQAPLGSGATLAVGVAVQADATTPLEAAFDHLRVQLAPAKGNAK